jgi:hypothetical protein
MKRTGGIFVLLVWASVIFAHDKENIYEVNIAKKDSTVRANVFNKKREIRTQPERTYYWFAYNKIFFTQGGYDGRLLHGAYACFYSNGNLKQKGNFNAGLKEGEWISWHENGVISEVSHWKNGSREGSVKLFDATGSPLVEANYRMDKLNGNYISYSKGKETERKKYKMGEEIKSKERKRKEMVNTTPSKENSGNEQSQAPKKSWLNHLRLRNNADPKKDYGPVKNPPVTLKK